MKESVLNTLKKDGTAKLALILTFSALFATSVVAKESAEEKGLELAKKAKKAEMGYHDYAASIKMTLQDAEGNKAAPNLIRISFLEAPGDGDKGLVTFDAPGDVKGTSLLTYSHNTGDDDQWLFLPSLNRVKRISSTNKSGPFMGSEFAYEDMCYQSVSKYKHKFIKQEKCSLGTCYVVERIPVDKESGYSKQLIFWDTKDFRVAKVEFFDRKGDALKKLENSNFKKFTATWSRPSHMVMTNLQTGRKTTIEWSNWKHRLGLTKRDFDTNSLQRVR